MKTRVITGGIIGLIVVAFFALRFVSPYIFDVMLAMIMICGAGEVSKVFNRSGKFNNMTLQTIFPVALFLSVIIGTFLKIAFAYLILIQLLILLLFIIATIIWTSCDKKTMIEEKNPEETNTRYILKKVLLTTALFIYPTVLFDFVLFINHFADFGLVSTTADVGLFALVMLFITTVFTDTFAYFVGSTFKGKKLCPYISPNKTISGAIGGLLGAIFGGIITYLIFFNIGVYTTLFTSIGLPVWAIILYSLFASVFTQAGDIFASWLKRTARTKDFSTIFPGHGGFMDRCDGLCFNALLTFILFAILF